MILIDEQRSQAAWGKVSLDNSGAHDYDVNLLNRKGQTIFAHADATVYVQLDKDYIVSGAINNDGRPNAPCHFIIDGVEIGVVDDPRYETSSYMLFGKTDPSDDTWHKLEIKTKKNGFAHTLWRFREASKEEKNPTVAFCACAVSEKDNVNRFMNLATPNGFTATQNLFVDQQKNKLNVPRRIASLIQTAISSNADIIVLSEINTLLGEDFYAATKLVYPGNGLIYYAQEIDEARVVSSDYALDDEAPKHTSAIALTANDWARLNRIPNEPVGVRSLISLIADQYTEQWGTLVRLNTGVFPVHYEPYVIADEPEPIQYVSQAKAKKKIKQTNLPNETQSNAETKVH